MRPALSLVASITLAMGQACAPAPAPSTAPAAPVIPAPHTAPTPATPATAPSPTPPTTPSTSPPTSTSTSPSTPPSDALSLERNPGQTPPLPDLAFPVPAAVPNHPGAPGPSPSMGPEDAPVVVFVFSDFQCPVCRRAVEPLKKLVRDHAPNVRVVFKQMALPSHPRARQVAIASLAAFRAGHFHAFHDRVFTAQGSLDDHALRGHAEALDLDLEAFDAATRDPAIAAQVDYESAIGGTLGVRGTPGFIVNGRVSVGWGSYAGLAGTVSTAIDAWRESGLPRGLAAARALTEREDPGAALALFPAP